MYADNASLPPGEGIPYLYALGMTPYIGDADAGATSFFR